MAGAGGKLARWSGRLGLAAAAAVAPCNAPRAADPASVDKIANYQADDLADQVFRNGR